MGEALGYMKNLRNQDKIQLSSCETWTEDGIVRVLMTAEICTEEMSRADGAEVMKKLYELEGPRLLLVDYGSMKKEEIGSRKYHSSDPEFTASYDRVALIVSNPVHRVIGSFFMGINKTIKPSRIFNSAEKAIAWLKE